MRVRAGDVFLADNRKGGPTILGGWKRKDGV
jgi:hypothetical protein